MKKLSKLAAILMVVVILVGLFAGCHEKGEIAFTIGNHEYTSAMYSCVLFTTASTARNAIDTFVSENNGDTENIEYTSYKFDENGEVSVTGTVAYEDFVKQEAVNTLKTFSVIADKMAAEKLELPEDYRLSAEAEASYYWNLGCDYNTYATYGDSVLSYYTPYSELFEPNGVLYDTYVEYMVHQATYTYYFEQLYGEGGAKEVPAEEIKTYINTHFVIADTIEFSKMDETNTELSEDALTALKAEADAYADRINNGEAFEVIYNEYNATQSDSTAEDSDTASEATGSEDATSSDTSTEEKEYTPESYTLIYGDEESGYSDSYFEDLYKADVGKAIVIDDESSSCYKLLVRGDILKEDYWFTNMRTSMLYALKQNEFDEGLISEGDALAVNEDTHATKPFKVKDIKF